MSDHLNEFYIPGYLATGQRQFFCGQQTPSAQGFGHVLSGGDLRFSSERFDKIKIYILSIKYVVMKQS